MALVLKDRVKESSTSSGTGSITLGGAFVGFQTFNSAVASGSTVYYTIHNTTAGNDQEWEVGVGTFTAPSTLTRDTVFSSSAGAPTKTNFSGSSVLEVFITQPAEQAVYINDATGKVEVFGNGTNVVTFTEINTTNLTANTVTLTAGTITTNAANNTDITNKQYVDGLFSQGVSYHEAVLVESPTALVAVYNQPNGAGNGVGATLTNSGSNAALVIDGVTLSNTARVLVYQQSNAVHNGVYTVTNPGAPDPGGAQWVLTRATDADTFGLANPNTLGAGDAFFVQSGNTGAGETYVCTTSGTITFGSSNITFAQISSAQIYAAGTGLNLSNLTFSIANTAVTAAQYGNDGNVAQITVNAQGQLTNAANVAINASSITVGTLANARTTASDANGASTIVARDSTGSFTANTITATTSNATTFNGTTGAFTNVSGNGSAISAINASNISSGTIANSRTTASSSNSASTIVLRDANGAFEAGNVTAANFIGAGSTITSINGSNVTSGTVANARTTASSSNGASTIVSRDAGGNFSANTITANISGDISGGTNINASNITSGTISNARTTASSANGASTIVLRDANGSFDANVVNATNLSGGGTSITSMNASNLSAGTVASARVSGSYTGITGVGTLTAGTWNANVIANNYTTAASANGASTIVARDANGSFAGNVVTATTLSGALSASTGSFSGLITSTMGNNTRIFSAASATTGYQYMQMASTGANLLIGLDASTGGAIATGSGAYDSVISTATATGLTLGVNQVKVARVQSSGFDITGTCTANTFSGSGSSLSAINASNVSSGTLGAQYGGTGSANLTAENVILGNGASAVKVVAPGTANNVLTSNGTTWISQAPAASGGFDAGTVMLFGQTAAPTGWTKDTTNYNNSGLRVVTGTASTGGTVDFTTAFASQTPTGSVSISAISGSAGATTLTTPQIPSHTHPSVAATPNPDDLGYYPGSYSFSQPTGATGGGGSHTHPFSFSSGTASFSGNAINLAVKYVDVIRATKN